MVDTLVPSAAPRRSARGLLAFGTGGVPRVATADPRRSVGAIRPLATAANQAAVRAMPGVPRRRVTGPFTPEDPDDPTGIVISGTYRVDPTLRVTGFRDAFDVQCQPELNGVGSGRFTVVDVDDGPDLNQPCTFDIAGFRQFAGFVSETERKIIDEGEQAGQLTEFSVVGLLDEWNTAVVLPDFGAANTQRLGAPIQDVRRFDWTMNGLGNQGIFGEDVPNYVPSTSTGTVASAMLEMFDLPDVWPDGNSQWMWVGQQGQGQPRGFCHFRRPSPRPTTGKIEVWACAYDYAEVYVDGVPVLTCDTPGVAQHVTIDASTRNHLVAIKAYNDLGRAGVLFSMLQVRPDGLYDEPLMSSSAGWDALSYPSRTFISTPGQVIGRLHYEARVRGVMGFAGTGSNVWQLDFSNHSDSAGRPWPRAEVVELDVGMSYLDVLNRLAEDRIDYACSPGSRRLSAWVKGRGSGRTVASPWASGVDMTSKMLRRTART